MGSLLDNSRLTGVTVKKGDRDRTLLLPYKPAVHAEAGVSNNANAYDEDVLNWYPEQLRADLCWNSKTFKSGPHQYVVHLDENDIVAVRGAVDAFVASGLDVKYVNSSNFPLPEELHNRLRSISYNVHHGVGFSVLRGLDKAYLTSDKEHALAFCGIASHIGPVRETNSFGMSMVHIRDATNDSKGTEVYADHLHPSKLPHSMKFHSDRMYGDIIAMYVKEKAAVGGDQYLASFWTIYNQLMDEDPEILRTMAGVWNWNPDRRARKDTPNPMPAMMTASGRVITQFVWAAFHGRPDLVTSAQSTALHTVQRIAEQNCIHLDTQEGDIQIINNFALLHARDAYSDVVPNSNGKQRKSRHILRLGLRDPEHAWDLPVEWASNFAAPLSYSVEEQTIPIRDFDAWNITTTTSMNHG